MSQLHDYAAITTLKICKKKKTFIISDKSYCNTRVKVMFHNYVLVIQNNWRSYRARCIVYNIYSRLPDEIQRKIMFYTRENYLIKKHHHDVINNILEKNGMFHGFIRF